MWLSINAVLFLSFDTFVEFLIYEILKLCFIIFFVGDFMCPLGQSVVSSLPGFDNFTFSADPMVIETSCAMSILDIEFESFYA